MAEPHEPARAGEGGAEDVAALLPGLVATRRWRLHRRDADDAGAWLRLHADGTVGEYDHPNERRWELRDGRLVLLAGDGRVSVAFDTARLRDGELHLEGRHLLAGDGPVLCLDSEPPAHAPMRELSRHFVEHHGWRIGDFTYGAPEVVGAQWGRLTVGAYCSIGNRVTFVLGQHNRRFVSTYPFAMEHAHWPGVPAGAQDHVVRDLVIGSDVWIANGVTVMGGLTVGDGAILGAGAVVTHDVAPYAIVAGVPARPVGHRFSADVVERLLRLRWWDWPRARVDRMLPLMLQEDIHRFLDAAEREDGREAP